MDYCSHECPLTERSEWLRLQMGNGRRESIELRTPSPDVVLALLREDK